MSQNICKNLQLFCKQKRLVVVVVGTVRFVWQVLYTQNEVLRNTKIKKLSYKWLPGCGAELLLGL